MAQVILSETLGKENFWNKMMDLYPKSMKEFCEWLDKYKKAVNWNSFFVSNVKFHDIPYEMQQGIWICFAMRILNENFEQPEYMYSGFLEDDVIMVFSELEQFE